MLINPRLHKGLFAVKEATMPYIQSAVHAFGPSYVRHSKQSFIGGTYRTLADESMIDTPSCFDVRHRAELYTHKAPLHAEPAHRSIYIPETEASVAPCDTDILAITDEQHISSFAAEAQVNGNHALQAMPRTLQTVRTALTTAGHSLKRIGQTIASAAHATARVTRTAATTVRNAWRTFTSFKAVQLIIKFFRGAHALWKKRMKFSYAFYTAIFFLLTSFEVLFIQWGMYSEPHYAKGTHVSQATKILNSVAGQLTKFVSQMWLEQKYLFLINFVALALIYLALICICNRFWIATATFGSVMSIYAVANMLKVQLRGEPIIPADLSFLSGGDTGNIVSFIPKDSETFISSAVTTLLWFLVVCFICFVLDGRRKFIYCSWTHPFASIKNILGNLTRIIAAVLSVAIFFSFTWNLGTPNSWPYKWIRDMGYKAELWNPTDDAQANGPAISFLNLTHVKAMDEPNGYSKEAMQKLAQRYSKEAALINKNRANNLTDNNVVMILSESFSDPTRVPGIAYDIDPMPHIRSLKNTTTSGLMLSPGYGGGTANIEYQALTGLNLANFNSSLTVPYQQLVPTQKSPYSFNQIWNEKYGSNGSTAVHPYYSSMYLRNANYNKFKFSYFYTLDSKKPIWHQHHIDKSPDVDDASAYQCILDLLDKQNTTNNDNPQFLQLVTMQNHLPYNDWYDNNEFKDADVSKNLGYWDRYSIDTYTKGVSYTDKSTLAFLESLDKLDKPVTVIFYGDHLPGIYDDASKDKNNALTLHETDYFIWSNNASKSRGIKIDHATSYTSSNYFMAMAAEHMNAKVSPYLALLTKLRENVPAISRIVVQKGGRSKGNATYLDSNGNEIEKQKLSKTAKQLLKDYELVQYDQTSSKGYLQNTKFTQVPSK